MFSDNYFLNSLDLSKWNTAKVVKMDGMFSECTGLSYLNLTNWNTKNVKSMSSMFFGVNNVKRLDLTSFDTRKCNKFTSMFGYYSFKITVIANSTIAANMIKVIKDMVYVEEVA